jgi:hypothetical protein
MGGSVADAFTGQGHRISRAEDVPSALAVAAGHRASQFRFIEPPFDVMAIRAAVGLESGSAR